MKSEITKKEQDKIITSIILKGLGEKYDDAMFKFNKACADLFDAFSEVESDTVSVDNARELFKVAGIYLQAVSEYKHFEKEYSSARVGAFKRGYTEEEINEMARYIK